MTIWIDKLISAISGCLTSFNTDLHVLIQVDSFQQIKDTLPLLSLNYQVDYRNSQFIINNNGNTARVSVVKLSDKDDWYTICGRSFNLVAFKENLDLDLKSRIISRARLSPNKVFSYSKTEIKEFCLPNDLYDIAEAIKFKLQQELYT